MKLIDYHETCSCGASVTIQNTIFSSIEKLAEAWRDNHHCVARSENKKVKVLNGKIDQI